jgi:hypothetical protein
VPRLGRKRVCRTPTRFRSQLLAWSAATHIGFAQRLLSLKRGIIGPSTANLGEDNVRVLANIAASVIRKTHGGVMRRPWEVALATYADAVKLTHATSLR